MSSLIEAKAKCLCGQVSLSIKQMSPKLGACHCTTCRRWSGGPWLALDCGSEVVIDNPTQITTFNSSEWAERSFCKSCGTHLYYRLKDKNQYIVSAGILDHQELFVFDHQIFVDEKPAYYSFANKTHDMTGPEVFAQFTS